MFSTFSPIMVRPNQPLRQPLSTPIVPPTPPPFLTPCSSPVRSVGTSSNCQAMSLTNMGTTTMPECVKRTHYCNYCGQQGQFSCKGCRNTSYCSLACQAKDWKAHRHMCQTAESLLSGKPAADATVPLVTGGNLSPIDLKPDDASSHRRIFMKDLETLKVPKGTEIQACVVEFHSPERFYLHTQTPEMVKMLQTIGVELQKANIYPQALTYTPCVDEVCAVQFSRDMNWYRGLVQALAADQMKAKILYIDFGNEEDVPFERIKQLAADIQPFFPCAMECYISGVMPLTDSWSAECCMAIRRLIEGRTVTVKLLGTEERGNVHAVEISLSQGKQLSTFLIEHGYAAEKNKQAPSQQDISAMTTASFENFKRLSTGKDDNIWAQPPQALSQAIGDSFYVVVTHLQSPSDIIVQKVENARLIQELQMKLRDHYSHVSPLLNFRPAPGTVCCAQFSEDKQWYRAKVLAYPTEDRVCVGYIDFGNSEDVELCHLQPIPPSFLELPTQAFPCALAGLQPVGDSWSPDCIVALQMQVSNRILRIDIQGAHEEKALVALIDERSDPQANVAELLISAGFGTPASALSGGSGDDHQQKEKAIVSTTTQDSEPEPEVKANMKGSDFDQEQSKAEGTNLAPAETAVAEAELQPDSPFFPVTWKTVELPLNEIFHPCLAAVVSPSLFYLMNSSQTDKQKLQEVLMQLKAYCSSISPLTKADLTTLAPGAACCARFSGDNNWCRAVVLEIGQEEISVLCADYGNTEKLPISRIAPIPKNLLEPPFQIIRCALIGQESFPADWPEEVLMTFKSLLLECNLATALHSDGFVNVLSLNLASGGLVNEKILAMLQKPAAENPSQNVLPKVGAPFAHRTQSANSTKPEDCVYSGPCSCNKMLETKILHLESQTEQLIVLYKQFMEEIRKKN